MKRVLLMLLLCLLAWAAVPASSGLAWTEDELAQIREQVGPYVIGNAQRIYNQEMEGFSSVNNYINHKAHRLEGDYHTLCNAARFNNTRSFAFDITEMGANLGITCLTGNPAQLLTTVLSYDFDMIIDNSTDKTLQMLSQNLNGINLTDFVYGIAKRAYERAHVESLRPVMERVENNGGVFGNADDAVEFILLYLENKGAYAGMDLGINYYHAQLQQPKWDIFYELGRDLVLDHLFDLSGIDFTNGLNEYLAGKMLNRFVDGVEIIPAHVESPELRQYFMDVAQLTLETYRLLNPPHVIIYPPSHRLYLVPNGGETATNDVTVYEGWTIGYLPVPFRLGYRFLGWYDAPEDGVPVLETDRYLLTEDMTVYAYWERIVLDQGSCGDHLTYTLYGDYELVMEGYGSMTSAPWPKNKVASIIFPDGLTNVCASAFEGSVYLRSCDLPSGVTRIDHYAFRSCAMLSRIGLPAGLREIGEYAFADSGLDALTLPDGLTSLGQGFLAGNMGVTELTVPASVTAFEYTGYQYADSPGVLGNSAIQALTLAEGTTAILPHFCSNAKQLTYISFPDGLSSIGPYAFNRCAVLHSLTLPDSVSEIGHSAFLDCAALTDIHLGIGLKTIGTGAFMRTGLTSLILPQGITTLGFSMLSQNTALKTITIPASVTEATSALENTAIETVIFAEGCTRTFVSICAFNTSLTQVVLPSTLIRIDNYAFSNCPALTSISLPAGLKEIGEYAFEYSGLQGLTLPQGLTKLGGAFLSGNTGVKELTIPASVQVEYESYYNLDSPGVVGNSAVETLILAEGMTAVPSRLCSNAKHLAHISFPDSLLSIESNTFNGCTSLQDITLPDSVTLIDMYAFRNCTSLSDIHLGAGSKTIEPYAFSGTALTDQLFVAGPVWLSEPGETAAVKVYRLPDGVEVTDAVWTFNQSGIAEVTNGSLRGLRCGGTQATVTLDGLTASVTVAVGSGHPVTLPDALTDIEAEAFRGTSLEEILLPPQVQTIGSAAFADTGAALVHVPAELCEIADDAFTGSPFFVLSPGSALADWCERNGYGSMQQ